MGYDAGLKAENYFASLLNAKGLSYFFDDVTGYDFRVGRSDANCTTKVEVKSCGLCIREGQFKKDLEPRYQCGRFLFKKDQIEYQHGDDTYFCFIVRWKEQFIIYGFVHAPKLKKKRHITIHELRAIGLMDFEDFIGRLK